ncbi:MAG: DUF4169 family protein [Alphaproteobacteria bacterium]|nr:DUF4169 family protein [Alphaproteobacteria bacterium]
MADVISLNKARKVLQRKAAKEQAAENRIRFGQSKSEREKLQKEAARVQQEFAGKEIDGKTRDD